MLYQTARLKYDPDEPEGVSLRDVIKAFYNYGVCSEKRWPYVPREQPPGAVDVERAREARNVTLGAYYRLRPNLNTYHAALHEAEALLVSRLHDGWLPERVAAAKGEIVPPKPGERSPVLGAESHALLIVGYTSKGFLVLNSWGRDWGGWSPGGDEAPIPGVALWQYGDWADRIMDGWVLRLGAGAADAFEYSIGDMGLGFGSDTAARSTPIHAILGNFLHLDDGEFVTTGEHVSGIQTLRETERLLTGKKTVEGVLLTFAGGLLGLKPAAEQIARWKRLVRQEGWHPFTVLWCVDYVERARAVLDGVFAEAMTRAGKPGPQFDRAVEATAHGVGRALWRDIGCAAEHGARHGGPLHELVRAGVRIAEARGGFRLRIVAESEGAFALAALLGVLARPGCDREAQAFFDMLEVRRSGRAADDRGRARRARALPQRRLGQTASRAPESGCTCRPPRTSGGWRCRPTASPTSSWCAAPSSAARGCARRRRWPAPSGPTAAPPTRGGTSAAPSIRSRPAPRGSRPSGTLGRGAAHDPRADRLAREGRARRPGADVQLDLLYRSDVAGRLLAALAGAAARDRALEPS